MYRLQSWHKTISMKIKFVIHVDCDTRMNLTFLVYTWEYLYMANLNHLWRYGRWDPLEKNITHMSRKHRIQLNQAMVPFYCFILQPLIKSRMPVYLTSIQIFFRTFQSSVVSTLQQFSSEMVEAQNPSFFC